MRIVAHATKVWESPCRAGPSLPECRTRMMDYEGKKEKKKANSQTMLKCMADAVRVTWMLRMTTGPRLMDHIFSHRTCPGDPWTLPLVFRQVCTNSNFFSRVPGIFYEKYGTCFWRIRVNFHNLRLPNL